MTDIQDDEMGLWEYTYLLDSGVTYKIALTRGEAVPPIECDCPRDHSGQYEKFEAVFHITRVAEDGTREVYHGCPDMFMPYQANELLVSAGILGIGQVLNESCRAIVMQKMITKMMGGLLAGDQAVVMPVNAATGKPLDLMSRDQIKALAPLGPEMYEVLEQSRISGNLTTPVEEIQRVFGFDEAPYLEYAETDNELLREVLDTDEE